MGGWRRHIRAEPCLLPFYERAFECSGGIIPIPWLAFANGGLGAASTDGGGHGGEEWMEGGI